MNENKTQGFTNVVSNKYKILDKISVNKFYKIVLAINNTTNEKFALKIIQSACMSIRSLEKQAFYHSKLNSEYIIKYIEVIKEEEKCIKKNISEGNFIVLEYAIKGELYNYVKLNNGIYYKVVLYYFKQLINGIESMHNSNVCHRDIKLDNLLLDKFFKLKISDFEFCQDLRNFKQSSDGEIIYHFEKLGTFPYMAPEFFAHRLYPPTQSFKIFHTGDKVDIFASGVVLFIMLTGFFPFHSAERCDRNYKLLYEKKFNQFWDNKKINAINSNFPHSAKDLLNRIFVFDPDKRISIDEIKSHEFYNEPIPNDTQVYEYMNSIWLMIERNSKKRVCST